MNELDALEQEMREWKPRPPGQRLGRRLFGRAELAPAALRRAEFWNWLTPAAACVLTLMVAVGSANYRGESPEGKGQPVLLAGLNLDPAFSNVSPMVRLSQLDENVQWNVCPDLAPPTATPLGESPAIAGGRPATATNFNRN